MSPAAFEPSARPTARNASAARSDHVEEGNRPPTVEITLRSTRRPAARQKITDSGAKVVIDFARYKLTASRTLWYFYFIICIFLLNWPVNAFSLLLGIIVKQRTAAR